MIKAVVTDIEGTTSSLSFVKDVLFPYARANIEAFVRSHVDHAAVSALLADAAKEMGGDPPLDEIVQQLIIWIDTDQKITPLKALQGLIWEKGYCNGDFYGHIYDDALHMLRQWHKDGVALYVYSSGSAHAQKLLFSHTEHGDLTPLFSGYFDTRIGAKQDSESYRQIVSQLGLPAGQTLFLSDIEQEIAAASATGMNTIWLVRDGVIDNNAAYRQVASFSDIELQTLAQA